MALWICAGCSAAYAVGQSACPECRSTDYTEEHNAMPKITVHGGASNDALASEADTELQDDVIVQPAPEEESSPGSNSATSSPTQQSSDEPKTPNRRSRARTTANPS